MIHSFSCKNFYSFSEQTKVNFTVNDKVPYNNGYFKDNSGTRLSKVETIIGPNASGKTNLIKVLPLLRWLIVDSFNSSPESPIPVKTFAFGDRKKKPVEISVVFEIGADIYTYSFVLNTERILFEELKRKNKTKDKTTNKKIFSRFWDEKNNQYKFSGISFKLPKSFIGLLRNNASVISTANRLNHKESQDISSFWQQVETNIPEVNISTPDIGGSSIASMIQQHMAFNFYSHNEPLKKEAEKILSRFDLGLDGFEIIKEPKGTGIGLRVVATHIFEGKKENLPIGYESSGTIQLFVLLKPILRALDVGGIAVLDEVDVNLHPDMVLALLNLFYQPETNPKNAQILFSTHSHLILSKLDKYQIILVEKNSNCMSESWRLDEVSGVRADDNYYTKYISGTYGAVPKL